MFLPLNDLFWSVQRNLAVRLRLFSLALRRIHLNIVSLDWNSRRQLDGKVFLFHWSCFVLYSVAFETSVKGRLLSSINNCARSPVAMKNLGCISMPVLNSLWLKVVRFAMNKRSNNPSVFKAGNYCVRYFPLCCFKVSELNSTSGTILLYFWVRNWKFPLLIGKVEKQLHSWVKSLKPIQSACGNFGRDSKNFFNYSWTSVEIYRAPSVFRSVAVTVCHQFAVSRWQTRIIQWLIKTHLNCQQKLFITPTTAALLP